LRRSLLPITVRHGLRWLEVARMSLGLVLVRWHMRITYLCHDYKMAYFEHFYA
jgi:hypothetical protein